MEIKTPFVGTIVGKPGSGKSHLVRYICHTMQCKKKKDRFSIIVVFTKTKFNNAYDWVPDQWVHENYSKKVLSRIMRLQKRIRENGLTPPHLLLIFDDCLNNKAYQQQIFSDLIYNRRHYNISILFCTQYLAGTVPTFMREGTDLAFIFKQFSKNSLDGVFNSWGHLSFGNYYAFQNYMNALEKYDFITIDTRTDNVDEQKNIMRCPETIPAPRVKYLRKIREKDL